jgi:hypothetical protein
VEDSTKAATKASADSAYQARLVLDSLKSVRTRVDSLTKADQPVPDSLRLRLNSLRADSVRLRADSLVARVSGHARERRLAAPHCRLHPRRP